ncbi:MAG TPA: hypothetical protein VFI31_08205 [Pirellulales bacterium]|nr:hypothetical protein [Pirellulales bacterium]
MTDTTRPSSFSEADADGQNASQKAKHAAEAALHDLKDRAGEYCELGREKAEAMTGVVEEQIRQRPVQAVAIAAGIGFALGFLWTRRS